MSANLYRAWMRHCGGATKLPVIALAVMTSACSLGTALPSGDGILPLGKEPTVERQPLQSLDDDSLKGRQLAESELRELRGGFSVNGVDLSIAAQIATVAVGKVALITDLVLNNAGRLEEVASHTIVLSGATGSTPDGGSTSHGFVLNLTPQGNAPVTSAPAGKGSTSFQAVAGNSATTEIIQQLVNNSITTLVSNRVNGAIIDQSLTLNISAKNFSSFARTFSAFAETSVLGNDIARFH